MFFKRALAVAVVSAAMLTPAASAKLSPQLAREGYTEQAGMRVSASAASCWSRTVWETLHNGVGVTLDKYSAQIDWCGNGSTITWHAAVNPLGSVYYLGWSYKGQISYWNSGGKGFPFWEHLTQGRFAYSIPIWGTIQNWYPWLKTYARAGGGFSWSRG